MSLSDNNDFKLPIYYFPDGNIVIRCRSLADDSPSTSVHFRIYQGHLSAQSSVFSDMLTIPQGNAPDTYEGLPVVEFPTSPDTMADFLSFLYDPGCVMLYTRGNDLLYFRRDVLSGGEADLAFKLLEVIVLADMLMVEPIKRAIIGRLKQDWEACSAQHWLSNIRTLNALPSLWFTPEKFFEPASALHIARRFDEALITPMLLFELAFRHPYLLYNESPKFQVDAPLRARWDMVSLSDKKKVWKLWERILTHIAEQLPYLRIGRKASLSECGRQGSTECEFFFDRKVDSLYTALVGGAHPLYFLESLKLQGDTVVERGEYDDVEICSKCGSSWDKLLDKLQEEVFLIAKHFSTILDQF
ncbi:hypothetical protein CPB83DRAFT_894483 [Crepidotus variabilis]|uniref:BTB domain-containing protein n=1 Tax=Crepidotus variabilis TaxID=179855 RepID=A0A9P6JPV7_9AGAR|nr:hypothetical protein CPB83DRAFT_894483 [Crepidotus variabilis]